MSLYRIKPLEWEYSEDGKSCRCLSADVSVNEIPGLGKFNWYAKHRFGICDSLEAGKAACEAHWRARVAEVLEPVDVVSSVLSDVRSVLLGGEVKMEFASPQQLMELAKEVKARVVVRDWRQAGGVL